MRGKKAWFVALAITLSGCGLARAEFTPRSVTIARGPVTETAMVFYEGDLAALEKAGAEVQGKLELHGNAYAGATTLEKKAKAEGAAAGGTHVMLVDESWTHTESKITSDTATTRSNGDGTYRTTFTPGMTQTRSNMHATYAVVRVPPERWGDLPAQLRPDPVGAKN